MSYINARVLRDMRKRLAAKEAEPLRQALRHVVRNTTLPQRTRLQAQLRLNALPSEQRMGQVKNRCLETGRGRGVLSEFRLCRYQFRLKALDGLLTGVQKASW